MRTETEYYYKVNRNLKTMRWRKSNQKIGYVRYDKYRNITEKGEYGEIFHIGSVTRNADSSITVVSGHGRNYKKINTVHYYEYEHGKMVADQLWQFKNNEKQSLFYKTIFEYDAKDRLVREKEYDDNDNISRIREYLISDSKYIISKDSVCNFLVELERVDGVTLDTTFIDNLNRPVEKKHYYKNTFLDRERIYYDSRGEIVTEIRYDYKPDSLFSITERQYNFDKQLARTLTLSKIIGSTVEDKDIYKYNRKKLLKKVLHYSGDRLTGYTKYRYTLY